MYVTGGIRRVGRLPKCEVATLMLPVCLFVIAVLLIALVAFFIAICRYVEVDLSLPAGIRLKLRGRK